MKLHKNNSLGLQEKCKLLDQYKNEKKTMIELTKIWKIYQSTVYNIISKDKSIRLESAKNETILIASESKRQSFVQ